MGKNVVTGRVLPPGADANLSPTAMQAFAALSVVATEVAGYLKVREQERTRREEIAAYRDLELEKLRIAEGVLTDYFRSAFAERAQTLKGMFDLMEAAVARGDDVTVRETLTGIVDVAKSSPLAAAGDLSQIRAALDDRNHTWQF